MIVSIAQPAYLPWLGYFDRISQSDISLTLDNVMLERSSTNRFTNRNKILSNGVGSWLTVPIKTKGLGQPIISNIEIDNEQRWSEKHLRSINQTYSQAQYYDMYKNWLNDFYNKSWKFLNPMISELTNYLLFELDIKTPRYSATQLNVQGKKSDLILNLCKSVGATKYLSGPFGKDYLNINSFHENNIEIIYHEYSHPEYNQNSVEFIPYMCVLDLMFNHGKDSLNVIKSGRGNNKGLIL